MQCVKQNTHKEKKKHIQFTRIHTNQQGWRSTVRKTEYDECNKMRFNTFNMCLLDVYFPFVSLCRIFHCSTQLLFFFFCFFFIYIFGFNVYCDAICGYGITDTRRWKHFVFFLLLFFLFGCLHCCYCRFLFIWDVFVVFAEFHTMPIEYRIQTLNGQSSEKNDILHHYNGFLPISIVLRFRSRKWFTFAQNLKDNFQFYLFSNCWSEKEWGQVFMWFIRLLWNLLKGFKALF